MEERALLTAELISVTPGMSAGGDYSTNPALSATGRFVAFQSHAADLVSGDTNAAQDIFVRDVITGTTTLISVNADGSASTACGGIGSSCTGSIVAGSFNPSLSDNGRFVAFTSYGTDLVKDVEVDVTPNVFVRDRDLDGNGVFDEPGIGRTSTMLLSLGEDGTAAGAVAGIRPVISGNGASVAFVSFAPDVALDDPTLTDLNGAGGDVFMAGVSSGRVKLVSVNAIDTGSGASSSAFAVDLSIDGAGGKVAFVTSHFDLTTAATGGVADTNGLADIFVGVGNAPVELVTINADETATAAGASREPAISRNGRHVAFISAASNLVRAATDANGVEDIFVRDLLRDTTTLVSRSRTSPGPMTSGDLASPGSPLIDDDVLAGPVISDTGRFVAFKSRATNLLDPAEGVVDDNGVSDIFIFDRDSDADGVFDEAGATTTRLVSINSGGMASGLSPTITGGSFAPSMSSDGRYVAFASDATDLVPGVSGTNVFLRDMLTGTTTLISAVSSAAGGGPSLTTPSTRLVALSRSGNRVAFPSDTDAALLDPSVTDPAGGTGPFGEIDVFAGTPPTDIRSSASKADGLTTGVLSYRVFFDAATPFEIGFYRSTDGVFDAGDELLGMIPITDPDDLSIGSHPLTYGIGSGAGEIALPDVGGSATESDEDYFVLLVADHEEVVVEFDGVPFAEDNTGFFSIAYHEPGGPVFIHGRERDSALRSADVITATTTATDLTVTYAGAITGATTYPLADVTGLRVRAHGGDDSVTGSPLPDFIHGGDGDDVLAGGAGDDVLDGGSGDDKLNGGAGADTFFDGCGDDAVSDLDPASGDTYMVTPCSDDVFTDNGGNDTLDFSLAAQAITLNMWSQAIQTVDSTGSTLRLDGQWENFVGSPFGDTVSVRPLPVPRNVSGGDGLDDRLIFDALGLNVTFDGTTFMIAGHGDVTVSGFEEIQTINAAPRIIDNSDPGYSDVGGWFASDPGFQQGFNGGVRFNAAGTGNDVATWNFTNLPPGQYMVSATWTFAGDRAKDSPFTIRDGGPTGPLAASLAVNQEQNPGEFDPPEDGQNILFRNLAVVNVTGHELTVQLTDDADQFVSADAVRIETLEALYTSSGSTALPIQSIDDGEIGFTTTCAADILLNNAANRGAFGDRHRCASAADLTTWDFGVVPPGKYLLEATWTPDPLNPVSANYELHVGPDVFNFSANQQQAPNGIVAGNIPWQVLGQVEVDPLDVLEALLKGEGVADAVRLRAASDIEVKTTSLTGQGQLCTKGCVITLTHNAPDRRVFSKLSVQNTGSAELNLEPVMVTGTGFSVEAGFGATSLPPGAETEFTIAFDPTGLGMFSGDVVFGNNAFGQNPFDFSIDVNVVEDTTPPTVQLVPPPGQAEVSEVIEGTTLRVGAEAMDDLGGIGRVEFLVNDQVVATDTESPFETEIQVPTGVTQVVLEARAVDQAGNTGDSLPVVLDVLIDQPPVLSCEPPSGSFFPVGPTTVTCTATDDVRVEFVEFHLNSQHFVTVIEEPYVVQFEVPAGVNPIVVQASAVDSGGRIDLVTLTLSVFTTPIMSDLSTVVGPHDFSTSDSEFLGEPLVQPVRVFNSLRTEHFRFFPYGGSYQGGVRVATGDVNGDRVPDIITGAGSGASGGHVKVFDGVNGGELRSFFAFPGFTGGVFVASGDVNNDGLIDIITGAGAGATGGHVKVFSGQTGAEIRSFFAFPGFQGGVTVAGGDVNGDGFGDVIVGAGAAEPGGHVKVFSGQTGAEIRSFFAYAGFLGGVTVASGDVNSDGFGDIVVGAGSGAAGGHVKVFDGMTSGQLRSFFAYPGFTGGVQVATGDFNNDGTPDIITGPAPGAGPQAKVFDGTTLQLLDSFFAYDTGFAGGVFVSGVASPPVKIVPLPAGGGDFELVDDNDDVVVRRQGGGEVFRGPHSENARLRINGPPNVNDRLIVYLDGVTTSITFDGGEGGHDALRLDGTSPLAYLKHQFLSPTDGVVTLDPGVAPSLVKFLNLKYLGLEPIEDNLVVVDRVFTFPDTNDNIVLNTGDSATDSILRIDSNNSEVVDFVQPSGSLTIESAANDTADIGTGWTFQDTEVVEGQFVRILQQNPLTLRMIGPRDWNNPVDPLDVNASNSIEPLDALLVINELNDPQYHDNLGRLVAAASLADFPDFFYDVFADGFVVPLDALLIINRLNDLAEGEANDVTRPTLEIVPVEPLYSSLPDRVVEDSSRPSATTASPLQPLAALVVPSSQPALEAERTATNARYARGTSLSPDEYLDALDRLFGDLAALRTFDWS